MKKTKNNYVKTGKEMFSFDDTCPEEVAAAEEFVRANSSAKAPRGAVYKDYKNRPSWLRVVA